MKSLLLNIFLLFALAQASSSMAEELRTYTTIGNRSCQTWIDLKEKQQKIPTEPNFSQFEVLSTRSWLFGYLSGYNAHPFERIDLLDDIDADTITLWMDRYCANNPKKNLSSAARQLADELIKIKTKKTSH